MARPSQFDEFEILSEYMRNVLRELYQDSITSFWRKYLASEMSNYVFQTAIQGRKVTPHVVDCIISAFVKDADRIWEVLKKDLPYGKMLAYIEAEKALAAECSARGKAAREEMLAEIAAKEADLAKNNSENNTTN